MGVGAAQVLVEREAGGRCGGTRNRKRATEDCIGAELALVGSTVGDHEGRVHAALVAGVHAHDALALAIHMGHCLRDALAQVAILVAVAELDRLEVAGRGTRGHDSARKAAVLQRDLDLDGGIAAGVQDLTSVHFCDLAHDVSFLM